MLREARRARARAGLTTDRPVAQTGDIHRIPRGSATADAGGLVMAAVLFPPVTAVLCARAKKRPWRPLQGARGLCLLRGKGKDRHGAGLMPFA